MTWKTHCLIPRTSTEKESIWNACHWKKSLSNSEHHGEDSHPKMRKLD
uniref:ATPase 10 plasma membrane-type n=1 Tax=Rhizophora mucronata TaxID=61149 RepID=A0A2P2MS31_RHIMU